MKQVVWWLLLGRGFPGFQALGAVDVVGPVWALPCVNLAALLVLRPLCASRKLLQALDLPKASFDLCGFSVGRGGRDERVRGGVLRCFSRSRKLVALLDWSEKFLEGPTFP